MVKYKVLIVIQYAYCRRKYPKRFAKRLSDDEWFCCDEHLVMYLDEQQQIYNDMMKESSLLMHILQMSLMIEQRGS
jgi:hypothetical protein